MESPNPNLSAVAVERSRGGGRVDYDLAVTLKGTAMPGYIHDDLILVTDDSNPQIARVPVGGRGHRPALHFGVSIAAADGLGCPGQGGDANIGRQGRAAVSYRAGGVQRQAVSSCPAGRGRQPLSPAVNIHRGSQRGPGRPSAKIISRPMPQPAAASKWLSARKSCRKRKQGDEPPDDQPAAPPLLAPMPQ